MKICFMLFLCLVFGECVDSQTLGKKCDVKVGPDGSCARSLLQSRFHDEERADVKDFSSGFDDDVSAWIRILKRVGEKGDVEALKVAKILEADKKANVSVLADLHANRDVIFRATNDLESSMDFEEAVHSGMLVTSEMLKMIDGKDLEEPEGDTQDPQAALVETNWTMSDYWQSRQIKFCFASDVLPGVRRTFMYAAIEIMKKTCLTFKHIDHHSGDSHSDLKEKKCTEPDAIFVQSYSGEKKSTYQAPGCWSNVGTYYRSISDQWAEHQPEDSLPPPYCFLNLEPHSGCNTTGVAVHEIGHALGMRHEHQRPDRDSYVQIHWDNIEKERLSQFNIRPGADTRLPYDYWSIMHYGPRACSKGNADTIISKTEGARFGQRMMLSPSDVEQLNWAYAC